MPAAASAMPLDLLADATAWATRGPVLTALVLSAATLPLDNFKFSKFWRQEFVGTIVMVALTFSPGKWVGLGPAPAWLAPSGVPVDWLWHWAGVVVADYSCGGPHVNPGVSAAMLALGKVSYSQFVAHVGAQMAGGLVAFPLLQRVARVLELEPLGGPAVSATVSSEQAQVAGIHEFSAMFLLLIVIFALNWEPPAKVRASRLFYPVKQSLTAFAIRGLIFYLGAAGPAINPMLGTTWAVYALDGAFPNFAAHYAVYWAASVAGALAASLLYALYKPDTTFFGVKFNTTTVVPTKKKAH